MDIYSKLFSSLLQANVRFVVIGVGGANYYTLHGQELFLTEDRDLLLPQDPESTLKCWNAAESEGFELWSMNEPLGAPLDLWLAERVIERRAVITGVHESGAKIDMTYIMGNFSFDDVWGRRNMFQAESSELAVAALDQIVESKRTAGRAKDLLFLTTHQETLRRMLEPDDEPGS